MAYEQYDEIRAGYIQIKDLDVVNYILAAALKADKIPHEDLGLIMTYLMEVQAPSIYFQYAILRIHQNLDKVKLIDIAASVTNCSHLGEVSKI